MSDKKPKSQDFEQTDDYIDAEDEILEEKEAKPKPKPKAKKEKSSNWLSTMTLVISSTILTLLCLIPFGYAFLQKIPNPVGVVDLQKLVDENQSTIVAALMASPDISEQQRMLAKQQAQEFATKLSKAVEATAKECKCVLINKAAVLTDKQAGVLVDYTDKIRQEVKK